MAGLASRTNVVTIPYAPRVLQKEIHVGMDTHRFGAAVCHRRFGKSVCAVNHLQKAAVTCPRPRPRFGYIAPTYTQGKSIAWDYMKHYAAPIPGHTVHESELRIGYPNGGQVRIFGADNPDSLRGLYFDGIVLDEYGLHPPKIYTEVLRPAISDREGWALFLGTPNGKNQFYDIINGKDEFLGARNDPTWFYGEYKASQTGILIAPELHSARQAMTADEYAQEYECSFEASVQGAVYAREMQAVREQGRVTRVPIEPMLPVDTDWDLGMGDSTAIVFSQTLYSGEVRIVDYYEHSGEGLAFYKQVLTDKGYTYGVHWAPHDIQVKELGVGRSRLETAGSLGLHFSVTPKVSVDDGIHAVRMLLPKCWFDADRAGDCVEVLQNYRWDYNTRIHEFKHLPVHDWASHGADAFRGLAVRHQTPVRKSEKQALRDAQRDTRDPVPVRRGFRSTRFSGRRGGY
jgi:hypothetical protein